MMRMFASSLIAIGMAGAAGWGGAAAEQAAQPAGQAVPPAGAIAAHADWPAAQPADVSSPRAIVAAFSETISGEAGVSRDWTRLQSLLLPGAGRMVTARVPRSGPGDATVLTFDEYKNRAGSQTFYERPISYKVESFGRTTHVYESYGIYRGKNDAKPAVRGVNSWELLFDGSRYWVVQVFWDTERPDNPIPADLLP